MFLDITFKFYQFNSIKIKGKYNPHAPYMIPSTMDKFPVCI